MSNEKRANFEQWINNDSLVVHTILCTDEPMSRAFTNAEKLPILFAMADVESLARMGVTNREVAEGIIDEADPHRLCAAATIARMSIKSTLETHVRKKYEQTLRAISVHRPPHETEYAQALNRMRERCQGVLRSGQGQTFEGWDPQVDEDRISRM